MASVCVGNKNLDAMQRYPDIAFYLHFMPFKPYTLIGSTSEDLNAVRSGQKLHGEDIAQEIAGFLEQNPLEEIEILYLFGIGLGYHYHALRSWLKAKPGRLLIILEDDLGAIAAMLEHRYATQLLTDPQVHLRFFSTSQELAFLLKELVALFPSEHITCAAIASYKKRKRRKWEKICMQLYRYTTVEQALMTEAIFGHKLMNNLIKNIFKWPGSFLANGLKDNFKAIPAIICGAGPSLGHTFDVLKNMHDRALIIAGGSTISALSNQGIIPHIGLALDPNPEEFERLKSASSFEMPLIYATRLEPHVFNTCNGERGYLRSQTGGPCELHFEKIAGIQGEAVGPELGSEALSVTTLCVALAVEMGCDPIILNGIDLAFSNMQRYAEGVLPSSKIYLDEINKNTKASDRLVMKKDIYGNRVCTLVKWVMESECIAHYAKLHPECRFFNATQGGLGFPDIPNQPLAELIDTHCYKQTDLSGLVHMHIQEQKIPLCTFEKIHEESKQICASLMRLQSLAEQILQELELLKQNPSIALTSGKILLLESDFEEERAFHCLFFSLGPALERLLNRSYFHSSTLTAEESRDVQLRRAIAKWTHLQEMIETEKNLLDFLLNSL